MPIVLGPIHTGGNPDQFVESVQPYALIMQEKTGMDWRIIAVQSGLESGWGKHIPADVDTGAVSNNFFGIKQFDKTKPHVMSWTVEEVNGQKVNVLAPFRKYDDPTQSIEDFVTLISTDPRYAEAWAVRDDPEAYFHAIGDSPYATDSEYTNKLIASYNARRFDQTPALSYALYDKPINSHEYFGENLPVTTSKEQSHNKADREGTEKQEKQYYMKLQHINDDEDPTGAFTFKIQGDSQAGIIREKIFKVRETDNANTSVPQPSVASVSHWEPDEPIERAVIKVEKSGSLMLFEDAIRLAFHNTGERQENAPKIFNEIEADDHKTIMHRRKESQEGESVENVILTDENITIELFKDDERTRVELTPNRILVKNHDKSYVLVDGDLIHAKNKTESEISIQGDTIAAVNKDASQNPLARMLLRGTHGELRVIPTGTVVSVSGSNANVHAPNNIKANAGNNIDINAGGNITITAAGTITLSGSHIYIN